MNKGLSKSILAIVLVLLVASVVTAEETVTLRFLTHMALEEPARTCLFSIIEDFEEAHPNVRIEVEGVPNVDIPTKIVTYSRAKQLPDLMGLQNVATATLAETGELLDLTDMMAADNIMDDFFNLEPARGKDGKIYGMPVYAGTDALYYNPRMFEEAGLNPDDSPRTWDELLEHAKKLTRPEIGQYGFSLYGKPVHALRVIHYMQTAGPDGNVLRYNNELDKWDILVNSPASLKAWEYLRRLVDERVVPPNVAELDYPASISLFGNQKIAMLTTGPWGRATIRAVDPDVPMAVSYHPTPDGTCHPSERVPLLPQ